MRIGETAKNVAIVEPCAQEVITSFDPVTDHESGRFHFVILQSRKQHVGDILGVGCGKRRSYRQFIECDANLPLLCLFGLGFLSRDGWHNYQGKQWD